MTTFEAKTRVTEAAPAPAPAPAPLGERVAFVTGGTRGIGAAISRRLAAAGVTVAAGYNNNREKAEAFLAELSAAGAEASAHAGNVANAEDCRRTVAEVIERHGRGARAESAT